MNRVQQVLTILKPKIAAFGFNQKEVKGIAANIADNLVSAEDAAQEDINAEIETKIQAVIPLLEFGRSYANRVINEKKNEIQEEEDDFKKSNSLKSSDISTNETKENETPEWAKLILQTNKELAAEIAMLKGEKVSERRKIKLEKLLKDTGTFGVRTLKSFGKMKFENEEEFDEFYTDVEEDLKAFNQERANHGLASLGTIPTTGSQVKAEKNNVLSDEAVKKLAAFKA